MEKKVVVSSVLKERPKTVFPVGSNGKLIDTGGVPLGKYLETKIKEDKKKKRLAIVGFAPSTVFMVNDLPDKDTWEVWGLNELYLYAMQQPNDPQGKIYLDLTRFTRWFEIHARTKDSKGRALCPDVDERTPAGKKHIEILNQMPVPVYMRGPDMKVYNDVANAVEFPYLEIAKLIGRDYWTNSPAWMLGFAIWEAMEEMKITGKWKWEEITVLGVDMAVGWHMRSNGTPTVQNEYATQRPSCEWAIGIIDGLRLAGIKTKINIPKQSSLMKKYCMYAFEDFEPIRNDVRVDLLERMEFLTNNEINLQNNFAAIKNKADAELQNIRDQIVAVKGTKQEIEYQLSHYD